MHVFCQGNRAHLLCDYARLLACWECFVIEKGDDSVLGLEKLQRLLLYCRAPHLGRLETGNAAQQESGDDRRVGLD